MKGLSFSDAHLDASTGGMRRIEDLERAFDRVEELANEHQVDVVIFQGDLANPDCGSILVRVLDTTIRCASNLTANAIPSHWVAGNHDVIEDGSGYTTLRPLSQIPGVHIHEVPGRVAVRSGHILFLPFPTRVTKYDPEKYVLENCEEGDVVIGHATYVEGAIMGSETRDMARGGSMVFPVAACKKMGAKLMLNGHYHREQVTPSGVHIPGSLERLRFDEEGNTPGVLIWEA